MTKRIFRSMFAVSALVLIAGIALILGVLYGYFGKQLNKELVNEAEYLSTAVEVSGADILNRINTDERITLVSPDGKVLFDSDADASKMENHLEREEIREAIESGTGQAERNSDTMGEMTVYYAMRLENGEILRVSGTRYTIISLLFGILGPFMLVVVLMLILSGFFAYRSTKSIVKPINDIDPEHPDAGDIYDELSPLVTKIEKQQTTIKAQLAEAKRQQEEFSLITDNMQEGLLVTDEKTDLLSYNSSALKLLDAEYAETGKSVYLISRREPFTMVVEKALSGEHAETLIETVDRTCRISAGPVFNKDRVAGAVILITDETEKIRREEMRREFSANVSHELKTPLTSISGFAELLKNGMVRPEDSEKFAGKIFDEAQRLIALVEDIIEISKLDEEKSDYNKENVNVCALIDDTIKRLEPAAEKKKVTIHSSCEKVDFFTVRSVFDEIIFNLCDNAVKYNKDGGSVDISARKAGDMLEIEVSDTGIGIPRSQTEHIFERFYRVDKSHSRSIGGTGLGLSIVKHGVIFLGGSIELDSVLGKGSSFKVKLPLSISSVDSIKKS